MKRINIIFLFLAMVLAMGFTGQVFLDDHAEPYQDYYGDNTPWYLLPIPEEKVPPKTAEDIILVKEFAYDKYTLEDKYPYKDTFRVFQWDTIRGTLAMLENLQRTPGRWGLVKNRANVNGAAPLAREVKVNKYKRVADMYGVEKHQGIPLYKPGVYDMPERYGVDGSLVKYIADSADQVMLSMVYIGGDWIVPSKYVKLLSDTLVFNKVIVVDKKNQNITTLEKSDTAWFVRSMNPATTGLHHPPYQYETPTGIFVVQEKKPKMIYMKDGTNETGGFAPHASRFSNGAYIHGVPVNLPQTATVEYSATLGTTPRSHKCVRNATSHAKYVYDWAPVEKTVVVVVE